MPVAIVVDSGTTNTRVRLWDGAGVAFSAAEPVGARNTAVDGHSGQVRGALQRLIAQAVARAPVPPAAVLCAGMVTANVGLLEVPHIPAPAGVADLAAAVVRHDFPDISPLPFYFIPGIKTVPAALSAATLGAADILRGEETEVAGLRELLGLDGPVLLLHCGSHHKAIAVDGAGRVLYSRTAVTGELLQAVSQHTVLKSSILPLDQVTPDPAMWRLGLGLARAEGFGRALFLTRVAEQVWGRSKAEATSLLLGALASLDLPLLAGAQAQGAAVVLYGQGHFPPLLQAHLDAEGWPDVRLAAPAVADLASAVGAVRIFEARP